MVAAVVTRQTRLVDLVGLDLPESSNVSFRVVVHVRLPGGRGRVMGGERGQDVEPVQGATDDIADHLARMAAAGAAHLQLVVDPITQHSIEALGVVLAALDR